MRSQLPAGDRLERYRKMSVEAETQGLADAFKGVTTSGSVVSGLFPIRSTGVSTEPVRKAADAFLTSLSADLRAKTVFPVDDPEWRKWMNQHFYLRQGVSFKEMSETQREAAFGPMRASLSAKGLKLTRDIMRLNDTLGELNNNNFEDYGEWLYWITVMGSPSAKEPWGWQLDGHHAIINYFVLGDQVVMTPFFVGSEPVIAHSGKYKGYDDSTGRAKQGAHADQRADGAAAQEGDPELPKPVTTVWRRRSKTTWCLTTPASRVGTLGPQKETTDWTGCRVCTEHGRRAQPRENERGSPASRQYLVRLDRRHRAEECFLLSHP